MIVMSHSSFSSVDLVVDGAGVVVCGVDEAAGVMKTLSWKSLHASRRHTQPIDSVFRETRSYLSFFCSAPAPQFAF